MNRSRILQTLEKFLGDEFEVAVQPHFPTLIERPDVLAHR